MTLSALALALGGCSEDPVTTSGAGDPEDALPEGVTVVARGQFCPNDIAVNQSEVFWVSCDAMSTVMKASTSGGEPVVLAERGYGAAVVADEERVYWHDWRAPATVRSTPVDGGPIMLVTKVSSLGQGIGALALDADHVYWAVSAVVESEPVGRIMKVPKLGGEVTVIAEAPNVHSLVADEAFIYWATEYGLWRAPSGGGEEPVLLTDQNGSEEGLVVDADSVYFQSGGGIAKVPKDGGSVVMLVDDGAPTTHIAGDEEFIYWSSLDGVRKVPKAGGEAITIAEGKFNPGRLTVDATSVYWVNEYAFGRSLALERTVMRAAK